MLILKTVEKTCL